MPFENPNGLTNFLEMLAILVIPASLTYTYGRMVGSRRQGWTIFGAMFVLFAISVAVVYIAESRRHARPARRRHRRREPGGQGAALRHRQLGALDRGHHGHLVRRGQRRVRVADRDRRARPDGQHGLRRERLRRRRHRPLHDAALRPAGRLHRRADGRPHARVPGQEDRGARGQAGRARPAVHAAGDPDRHEPRASRTKYGAPSIFADGPQGFSETLYAYLSQANNNGSAFAGYTGYYQPEPGNLGAHGITFADLLGGLVMMLARFIPIVFTLAVAGVMVRKRVAPAGLGTMRTDTPTFGGLLIGTVVLIGAPHLLPRPAARTRRPGPHRPPLLR